MPHSIAALADPTVARGAKETGRKEDALETSGLVQRIRSVDVCGVFSPPRVAAEANKYGMAVGDAMDLTTGWDSNIPEHRDRAENM